MRASLYYCSKEQRQFAEHSVVAMRDTCPVSLMESLSYGTKAHLAQALTLMCEVQS